MRRASRREMTAAERGAEQELYKAMDAGQPAPATTVGALFSMPKRAVTRVLRELRHRLDGQPFGVLSHTRSGEAAARTAVTRSWQAVETLFSGVKPRLRSELMCRWAAAARPELADLANGAVAIRLVGLDGRLIQDQVEPSAVVGVSARRGPDGGVVAGLHRLVAVPGGVTVAKGSRVALFGCADPSLAALDVADPFTGVAVAAVGDLETEGPSGDPVWPSLIATMPAEAAEARLGEPTPATENLFMETVAEWFDQGRPDAFPQSPSLPAVMGGVELTADMSRDAVAYRLGDRWANAVRGVVMDWLSPLSPLAPVAVPMSFLKGCNVGGVSIDLTANWSGVVTMSASAAVGVEAGWAWDLS